MVKICLIGNSHAASIKSGWTAISKFYPDVDLTIYPFHGLYYETFTPVPEEGLLRMEKDIIRNRFIHILGGDGHVHIKEYDHCIIVGGVKLQAALFEIYSEQVRRASLIDWYENSHIHLLVKKIRVLSDLPISITVNPLRASRDIDENWMEGYSYQGTIDILNDHLEECHNARMIGQPDRTIEGAFSTKVEYAVGEYRPNTSTLPGATPVIEDDLMHMNSAFGALMLAKIMASIGIEADGLKLPEPDGHIPLAERNIPPKMIKVG